MIEITMENGGVIKVELDPKAAPITCANFEKLAREGREYREELICDVIRMGAAALPDMRGESLSAICGTLGLEQLRELKKAFSGGGKLNSQLSPKNTEARSGNSEFRI